MGRDRTGVTGGFLWTNEEERSTEQEGGNPPAGGTNRNAHAERPGSGTSVIPHRPGPDRFDALALVLATPLEGRGGRPNKGSFFLETCITLISS